MTSRECQVDPHRSRDCIAPKGSGKICRTTCANCHKPACVCCTRLIRWGSKRRARICNDCQAQPVHRPPLVPEQEPQSPRVDTPRS